MPRTTDIIDPKMAGTLAGLFRERVRRSPGIPAYQRYSAQKQRFETISWQEAFQLAGRWQAAFAQEGLQKGDRVALMLRNCLEWILFDLAALGHGLVTVPLFFNDRPSNIRYILRETGAKLILAPGPDQWRQMESSGSEFPELQTVVVPDPYTNAVAWDRTEAGTPMLASMTPQEAINQGLAKPSETDILVVIFWSPGTS